MATVARTRPDFATIDVQITHALFALRLARVVTARRRTQDAREVEGRAEASLNSLLDYRHARQQ
jgi:hypothetical protein